MGLQEEALAPPVRLPDVERCGPAAPPYADPQSLGRRPRTTEALCRLAERLAAPLVDLGGEYQGRPSVPGRHPLDMSGARQEVVGEADVVLALDDTSFLARSARPIGARGRCDT